MQDPILFWNDVALECNRRDHTGAMNAENQKGPGLSSRALAIVHLAINDAYFGVKANPSQQYLTALPAYGGANTDVALSAAVSGAAASALCALYSAYRELIETKLAEITATNGSDSVAMSFGRQVANTVLALRQNDGAHSAANPDEDYVHSMERFRHRQDPLNPDQGYLGVKYGKVPTFASTAWQGLDQPPLPPNPLYQLHYDEVREKGGAPTQRTTQRSPEQTTIGLYWAYDGAMQIGTPPRLYNQIVREIATKRNNSTDDNARLFALINVAMADAGIHAWYWKYCYDLWRPVIGIREHDKSTGPTAECDPAINSPCDPYWLPLGAPRSNEVGKASFTPHFPAYPSGHATFGAAAFEVVRRFYRQRDSLTFQDTEKDKISFCFVSDELNAITRDRDGSVRTRHYRKYNSVADAMYENSVSRVYLGVHWRFDGTSAQNVNDMLSATDKIGGVPLGRAIGADIFTSGMKQQASPPTPTGNCV
jgi:membrane-associated phospholipid phosphatase